MLLTSNDLAGYIKERHARQVKALRARRIYPQLAIVQTKDDPVINTYTRVKKRYGEDIGIRVEVNKIAQSQAKDFIPSLNAQDDINGIVLQLPLEEPSDTDRLINLIDQDKDVDGLRPDSPFDSPTPVAIFWLMASYGIELDDKQVVVVGRGRLVGAPLVTMLENSGIHPIVLDEQSQDLATQIKKADIVITAAGQPKLIADEMVKKGAVVIDVGISNEGGQVMGDVEPALYEREDIQITPARGGIGPLTVAALFENLLSAAEKAEP